MPAGENDFEDEDAPEQAPSAKRSRQEPQFADSGSESQSESGDSQSDSVGNSEQDEGGGGDDGPTLGQLVALRQDGSTSAATMKARARAAKQAAQAGSFKRTGKHRPAEMSSKRPVPVLRESLQGGKRDTRDPRFESLSAGQYQEDTFKKQYAFLYDEKMPQERDDLRAALKKAKGAAPRAELQAQLDRVNQQLRSEEARRKREGFKGKVKAKEREAVKDGKRPFFLKKSEQRRLELVAKYDELQASGQLEKYMAKRRRKNASKDHRHLPAARRDGGGD